MTVKETLLFLYLVNAYEPLVLDGVFKKGMLRERERERERERKREREKCEL